MINENGTLAHPHPLFSFLGGMAKNYDFSTITVICFAGYGLTELPHIRMCGRNNLELSLPNIRVIIPQSGDAIAEIQKHSMA
jgi:hypothetical protein